MTLSLVPRHPRVTMPKTVTPLDVTTSSAATPTTTVTTITALPDTVNLNLYTGDDFSMSLTLTNPDGSNTSLIGSTVLAQIRSALGAAIAASFVPSISGNVITLTLPNTATMNLIGKYVWDCQVTSTTGQIWTLVAGSVNFTQDVTR